MPQRKRNKRCAEKSENVSIQVCSTPLKERDETKRYKGQIEAER